LQEHPNVTERSEEEVRRFREEKKIKIKGNNVPKPVTTFEEARFPKYIND